jgi:hypothetical protein
MPRGSTLTRHQRSRRSTTAPRRKTGGRRKGTPNKQTTDVAAIARALVDDLAYRTMFKRRLRLGKLKPQVETMLWHYAYGKPVVHVEVAGEAGGPVLVRFVDVAASPAGDA